MQLITARLFRNFIVFISFQVFVKVECTVNYGTYDIFDSSGQISALPTSNQQSVLPQQEFAPRTGNLDIDGHYWSRNGRNEYQEDPEAEESAYPAQYANEDEYMGQYETDGVSTGDQEHPQQPHVTIDRKDTEHTVTISMPRMERNGGQNNIIKKFVIQPVIQYVVQYDKNAQRDPENVESGTQMEEYEGIQGQERMIAGHEAHIDRYFNDVDAKFETYWGNEDGNSGGGGNQENGNYEYSLNYDNGHGGNNGGSGYNNNQIQQGNDQGFKDFGNSQQQVAPQNNNIGGGMSLSNAVHSAQQSQQQQGPGMQAYGPPGFTQFQPQGGNDQMQKPNAGSGAMASMMGGGLNANAMGQNNMDMTSQNQMMGMNTPPQMSMGAGMSSAQMSMGSPQSQMSMGTPPPQMSMGMGQQMSMGMGPAPSSQMSTGSGQSTPQMSMGAGQSPPQMSMNQAPQPQPMYGVPGQTPGQPIGPTPMMMPPSNRPPSSPGLQISGMFSLGNTETESNSPMSMPPTQMIMPMPTMPMSMPMNMPILANSFGPIAMTTQVSPQPTMANVAPPQPVFPSVTGIVSHPMLSQMNLGMPPSTSMALFTLTGAHASQPAPTVHSKPESESLGQKGSNEDLGNIPVLSHPTPSTSSEGKQKGGRGAKGNDEEPRRPKKPRGPKRGRGKSLFSLPSLSKLPQSIGGHLSFMFSTGFGKNRRGRGRGGGNGGGNGDGNGSGNGGWSKPDGSKSIDKEQVSEHILNILGLKLDNQSGHSHMINASDTSTNPIVLWEQQRNQTSLNHTSNPPITRRQGGTPEDIITLLHANTGLREWEIILDKIGSNNFTLSPPPVPNAYQETTTSDPTMAAETSTTSINLTPNEFKVNTTTGEFAATPAPSVPPLFITLESSPSPISISANDIIPICSPECTSFQPEAHESVESVEFSVSPSPPTLPIPSTTKDPIEEYINHNLVNVYNVMQNNVGNVNRSKTNYQAYYAEAGLGDLLKVKFDSQIYNALHAVFQSHNTFPR